MLFTVMITTRNRLSDLEVTCRNIKNWDPQPDEVIICADGCTDNTNEFIKSEFPEFILISNEQSLGSVGSRDRILRMAQGKFVICLDDDSYPLDFQFLKYVKRSLDEHPEAGVITFSELRNDGLFSEPTKTPESPGKYVSAYPNCAAAMRRELYLKLPGFPSFFNHMYEEPDYALQCYSANFCVWFEPSIIVRHYTSAVGRQPVRRHHQNARNELWSVWLRCPLPWLIPVSIFRIVRQFQYACKEGLDWAIQEPVWWWTALIGIHHCIQNREPVPWSIYYEWMKLPRNCRIALSDLEKDFGKNFFKCQV